MNEYHALGLKSSTRSTLFRYQHEPVPSSFLRRDIPPIVFVIFFLFLVILILSQVFVVHSSRYGTNLSAMKQIQEELKQMDESMGALLRDNALPIDQWRLLFSLRNYLRRFHDIFDLFNIQMNSKFDQTRQFNQHTNTQIEVMNSTRPFCSRVPMNLRGRVLKENSTFVNISIHELEITLNSVRSGGRWSPTSCLARHKVAIIIPYRDRFEHLVTLLYYLHPILQRQELDYKIFVSEQLGNGTYNKAVLMNAAFIHASKDDDFQCFVFHDVDLIPEDDRNMYSCPPLPRHMSVAVDELNYQLSYEELIGGVLNIRLDHFLTVNGYSNLYWGWGAEDDDLFYRLKEVSLKVIRPPSTIARYKMLQHKKRTPSTWNKRAKLLYSAAKRYTWDGLSSAKYNLTSVTIHRLFTHLLIDVGTPPPGFN